MGNALELRPIARANTPYTTKFGVPRQAGLVRLEGRIVFEPEFRIDEAVRGIETFSHIWLIWAFSHNIRETWTPTVRPPRLGGSARQGVFATRSSFRPNSLALSCVELVGVEESADEGKVLRVRGMDMVDGTPIYDIKPYIPYADSLPEASAGWLDEQQWQELKQVEIPSQELEKLPEHLHEGLHDILAQDPRPAYRRDLEAGENTERTYWLALERYIVYFRVDDERVRVTRVRTLDDEELGVLRETGQIADDYYRDCERQ